MAAKSYMAAETDVEMPVGVLNTGPVSNPAHPVMPSFPHPLVPRLFAFICFMPFRVVPWLSLLAGLSFGNGFPWMKDWESPEHNLLARKDRIRVHLRRGDHERERGFELRLLFPR